VLELTERIFDFGTLGVQNRVHAELLRLAKQAGAAARAKTEVAVSCIVNSFLAAVFEVTGASPGPN
jgi:hypothetical protein